MEFKVGDWVVNILKGSQFFGCIGQVRYPSKKCYFYVSYEPGEYAEHYIYRDNELRHATPQEVAHFFAEEICNGV